MLFVFTKIQFKYAIILKTINSNFRHKLIYIPINQEVTHRGKFKFSSVCNFLVNKQLRQQVKNNCLFPDIQLFKQDIEETCLYHQYQTQRFYLASVFALNTQS